MPPNDQPPPRSGLAWAVLSGVCWGADGVVLGVAFTMAPFLGAAALVAPLAVAALHDGLATGWMVAFNGATGRLRAVAAQPRQPAGPGPVRGGDHRRPHRHVRLPVRHQVRRRRPTPWRSARPTRPSAPCSRASSCASSVTRRGWAGVGVTVAGAVDRHVHAAVGRRAALLPRHRLGVRRDPGLGHRGRARDPRDADDRARGRRDAAHGDLVRRLHRGRPAAGRRPAACSPPRSRSTSFWLVLGASVAGAASYLTYYAANHLVGASRAMPLNSLYAVWAIVFSVVLLGCTRPPSSSPACWSPSAAPCSSSRARRGQSRAPRPAEAALSRSPERRRRDRGENTPPAGRLRVRARSACPSPRRRRTPARRATGARPRRRPRTTFAVPM